jgi:hypothetical protein
MCLYSTNKDPYIAEDDIMCYKILFTDRNELRSPYQYFKFERKIKYDNSDEPEILKTGDKEYKISAGYFHAYSDLDIAILYHSRMYHNMLYASLLPTIFTALIPKGSKYYIGDNKDICSDSIIIIEPIY